MSSRRYPVTLKIRSPVDGEIYAEQSLASASDIEGALLSASIAQQQWRRTAMSERAWLCSAFVDAMLSDGESICEELSWQMGRPVRQTPGEMKGFEERAR